MLDVIRNKLAELETGNDIAILYACESGSRAWGFESTDSDYDVRFIYARTLDNYLSIRERRDVIEMPVSDVLDISGWDIRKALQLFLKSNAPLYEWLQSPVVYKKNQFFLTELTALMPMYFSLRAGCHHYLSMATNTFENDLQADQVKLKKYFYALRSALAALWIVKNQSVPPMQFSELRTAVKDDQWQTAINRLLENKKAADEKTLISPVSFLQQWIDKTLLQIQELSMALVPVKHDTDLLDNLFRKYIQPS